MSNPIAGKQYAFEAGDTLETIASRVYGDSNLWPLIWQANQPKFKFNDPTLIPVGQIINIPFEPSTNLLKNTLLISLLGNKGLDEVTVVLNGREVTLQAIKIIRTMDTATDGWSATLPWTPGKDSEIDEIVRPYAYPTASIFLAQELLISGVLYSVAPELTNDGRIVNLEGWSFTADVVDSTLRPPYEANNRTLQQRATELCAPLGISVIFTEEALAKDSAFSRVTASETDTIFSHLAKLATQRGILITSTALGDLLFTVTSEGNTVGTIEEGQSLASDFKAKFDGRQRFNVYRAIGQSPGGNAKTGISTDENVPRSRFLTFSANDTTAGNIQNAADWKRSKALADALTIPFTVTGWRAPNGEIWRENTLVTVVSETISIPDGFTFLIKQVEYNLNNDGQTATLSLVPPQVYTGEPLVDPWT